MRLCTAVPRTCMAIALIAGLGFVGPRHCADDSILPAASAADAQTSHSCSCNSDLNQCCREMECGCADPLPQPANLPAVPAESNDAVQLLALLPSGVMIGESAEMPSSHDSLLAGFTTNLIAQGTRLNI